MDISQLFTGFILAMGMLHLVNRVVEQYCSHTDCRDFHQFAPPNTTKWLANEQRTSLHVDWFVFFNCSSFTLPPQQKDTGSRKSLTKHSEKTLIQTTAPRIQQRAAY